MLETWLLALQDAPFAQALRLSYYAYPIVNAAHILSIGIILGSILPLDLRLLGAFRAAPIGVLARVLEPVAAVAIVGALITGFLLFSVKPLEYIENPALWVKLALVLAGIVNAVALLVAPSFRAAKAGAPPGLRIRLAALLSVLLWTGAIFAGRFIAFVHVV